MPTPPSPPSRRPPLRFPNSRASSWTDPRARPVDPAAWLEQTERLVDRYREQLPQVAGRRVDPGVGFIWIAADHIFELHGQSADFALLDVPLLVEDCASLMTGKTVPFLTALASFYEYLGDAQVIDSQRAAEIRSELARVLEG